MGLFKINLTPIKDLKIIDYHSHKDKRGFFNKIFSQNNMKSLLSGKLIKQINHTYTKKKGTVRGLHFQYPPFSEIKIITCLKGKVWDVAVDLRKNSPTFLNYYATILTEKKFKSYLIPEGFAHGFQTLTSDCEILYFHTEEYNKKSEGAINALDNQIKIKWPENISERSDRDHNLKRIDKNFKGILL
jgi:dTDP-4-dehydrorhamnose 3,5-epimerase